jgi:hypothetical protein
MKLAGNLHGSRARCASIIRKSTPCGALFKAEAKPTRASVGQVVAVTKHHDASSLGEANLLVAQGRKWIPQVHPSQSVGSLSYGFKS